MAEIGHNFEEYLIPLKYFSKFKTGKKKNLNCYRFDKMSDFKRHADVKNTVPDFYEGMRTKQIWNLKYLNPGLEAGPPTHNARRLWVSCEVCGCPEPRQPRLTTSHHPMQLTWARFSSPIPAGCCSAPKNSLLCSGPGPQAGMLNKYIDFKEGPTSAHMNAGFSIFTPLHHHPPLLHPSTFSIQPFFSG